MAITLVQQATKTDITALIGPGTMTLTLPVPTTKGNSIIIFFGISDSTTGAITCSGGGTYTTDMDFTNSNSAQRTAIFSTHDIAGGSTTFTVSYPQDIYSRVGLVAEFSGLYKMPTALDQKANKGTFAGTSPLTTATTPATSGDVELVLGVFVSDYSDTTPNPATEITSGTGYTLLPVAFASNGNASKLLAVEYKEVTVKGTQSASLNYSGAAQKSYNGTCITYKDINYIAPPPPPPPAPSGVVQSAIANTTTSGTSTTLTLTSATTAGNSLIVALATVDLTGAVTCSGGGTYAADVDYSMTGAGTAKARIVVLSAHNISGGVTSVTITHPNTTKRAAAILEVSGLLKTGTPKDQSVTNNGLNAAPPMSSGTTPTTTQADELLVAAFSSDSNATGSTSVAGTDFTLVTAQAGGAGNRRIDLEYRGTSTTGAYSGTVGDSGTSTNKSYVGCMVTYKKAPTAAPKVTVVSVDHNKISHMTGANQSTVQFTFDIDIQAYYVRVGGGDYSTGTVAGSGTSLVTAGTVITEIIDHTEIGISASEGNYQINIYGQSTSGTWTPYNQP